MPPKKKDKGKGKKSASAAPSQANQDASEPTDKEILLQQELDQVTEDLEAAKARVEELRKENDFLQQEAHKVRVESHEYMSYMEKKTSKRQTTIITLSDHNKQQIKNLEYQQQAMEEEFAERKEELKRQMLEKQHLLEKTQQEINNLQEYKNLQTEQQNKIKELEKEVKRVRAEHSNTIQQLKTKFITEKKSYQLDSDSKIQTLEKAANKEATKCLTDHSERIQAENRELRRELMNLIRTTRALHSHKLELEEQKKQLLREQQYSQDLKLLRTARQHHVFKPNGELRDGEEVGEEIHAESGEHKAVET